MNRVRTYALLLVFPAMLTPLAAFGSAQVQILAGRLLVEPGTVDAAPSRSRVHGTSSAPALSGASAPRSQHTVVARTAGSEHAARLPPRNTAPPRSAPPASGAVDEIQVRGRVLGWDGAPLVGAWVELPGVAIVSTTDAHGRFNLHVTAGRYEARVWRMDHKPQHFDLEVPLPRADVTSFELATLQLEAGNLQAETVHVTAPRWDETHVEGPGSYVLHSKDVQREIGSFEDIMRSVQSLPGVARASDYHGEYFVRGAGSSSNTVYLDGVPIFFPYHILGFNSIFNPGIVESAEFYAGGAPAAYGGATGGLMLVRSRGETPQPSGGNVGLSYLSGHVRASGGDVDRGWALSLRRSYHDQIARLVNGTSPNEIPSFHDGMLRLRWSPSDRHLLVAGALSAGDGMSIANPEGEALRSDFVQVDDGDGTLDAAGDRLVTQNNLRLGTLYWRAQLGQRSKLETRFGIAPQRLRFSLRGENNESLDIDTQLLSVRQDLTLRHGAHRFRLGFETYRTQTRGLVSSYAAFLNLRQTNSSLNLSDQPERYLIDVAKTRLYGAAYGQDDWRMWEGRVEFSPGLRYEFDGLARELLVSPRAALSLRPAPGWQIRGTWGVYSTPRNSPMEVQPTASGEALKAERAVETSLGVTREWDFGLKLGASGYRKTFANLVYESEPAYYANGAEGRSRGVETWLELAPPRARFQVQARYAWSITRQRDATAWRRQLVDDAPSGESVWGPVFEAPYWYSPLQDQRHRLGVDLRLTLRSWEFGTHLQLASGLPYTPVESVVHDAEGEAYGIVGRKGSARLPRYERLDFRVTRHFRGDRLHWRLYAEVLNATASDNVYMYRWNRAYTSQYAVNMLPRLPTLGVEASF